MARVGVALVGLVLGTLGIAGDASAQSMYCSLNPGAIDCAPPPAIPCPQMHGTVDGNPDDHVVPPRLGSPLLPRRPDGRLPIGFNDQSTFVSPPFVTFARNTDIHRDVGSELVRYSLQWGEVEQARNSYTWPAKYDRIYCAALARGIRPVIGIMTSPPWAIDTGAACNGGAPACRNPPAQANEGELAEFAQLVARRYPQAAAIEAWNEPNLAVFWAGPDPARYVRVQRAIYTGVKNWSPSLPVIGGSLSNRQATDSGGISIYDFLEGMYSAGAASSMDALAVHPYPRRLENGQDLFDITMNGVRAIVEANEGAGVRRIWINELGVSSPPATEAQQSQTLRDVYAATGAMGDVDTVIFHSLLQKYDRAETGFAWVIADPDSGIAKPPFRAKRVYCDFAAMLVRPIDCSQPLP